VSIILRHAERQPIPAGSFGSEIRITASGTAGAEMLGNLLSSKTLGSIVSSPILRCVSTAQAIVRGAGWAAEVGTDWRLGDPGPFVKDTELAGTPFLNEGIREIVQRQLADGEALPGMRPARDGAELLLELTTAKLRETNQLNIYVTHDAILAVIVGCLYRLNIDEFVWPDFLDGLILWVVDDILHFSWRGLEQASHPVGGDRN
jgi:broad specificity phosphatase PhoE